VAGRYQLVSLLGRGGQGAVYRGRELLGHDDVAIKVLDDALAIDPSSHQRIQREAQALQLLEGTAAVRVKDQLIAPDGAFFLVMELLRGSDFESYLQAIERRGQHIGLDVLVRLLQPIVATLDRAHAHAMVHRDVKPANIFVVDEEQGPGVRLLDFGFAKFKNLKTLTETGFIAGSPSYLAPEAWRGASGVDHRADIYGLGAVIFRALSGVPPFSSDDMLDLFQMATDSPRPSLHALRRELPAGVDEWVAQALAIDPGKRFSNIVAMWNALLAEFG
jgi:serine/threonine-protein kinase